MLLCTRPFLVVSQRAISGCSYINGYWGSWSRALYVMNGSFSEFIVYLPSEHPSKYILKVKVYGMPYEIDKKEMKQRIKQNRFYEYSGSVEYFNNIYQAEEGFISNFRRWPDGYIPTLITNKDTKYSGEITQSYVKAAKILIAPYKKEPRVYNIFVEDFGIGIQIE